jgi:hypothetical protein
MMKGQLPFRFSALALVLLLAVLFYSFIIPLTPGRIDRPGATLIEELPLWSLVGQARGGILESPPIIAFLIVFCALIAFASYGTAIYLSWKYQFRKDILVVVTFATPFLLGTAVVALPNFNTDIYDFIVAGRVAAVYYNNPLYVPADHFPDDPLYPYASKQYTNIPGGRLPTWAFLNISLAWLGGNDPVLSLLVNRTAFMLLNLTNVALIYAILRQMNPALALTGVITYGWNPIVIVHGQSKTDTFMVFFLLLAIFWLVTSKKQLVIFGLTLSGFVKLITLPLIGVYWLQKIKLREWRLLAFDVILFTVTILALYLPFMRDPGLILRQLNYAGAGGESLPTVLQVFFLGGFFVLIFFIGVNQDGSVEKLLRGWVIVVLYFSVFLSRVQFSWYLMTLIALVGVSLNRNVLILTVALSFASFAFNMWEYTSADTFRLPALQVPRPLLYLTTALVLILLLVVGYWRTRLKPPVQTTTVTDPDG